MNYFEFNGVKSTDMGIRIERIPAQHIPRKRMSTITIPGRSGELHQWDGSYEPFQQSYACWFKVDEGSYEPLSAKIHRVKTWLATAPNGAVLRDSYDTWVYHRASYIDGGAIENIRDRYARFTVTFECDPRGFLSDDIREVDPENPAALLNPTEFIAFPRITATCRGSGTITVTAHQGETVKKVWTIDIEWPDEIYDHETTIDCEIQEAWGPVNGVIISSNPWVSSEDYPQLWPGQNLIEISGGIVSATVEPRWWTL